jgi:hypothetical protein
MVLFGQGLELMSRHQLEQLCEDGVRMSQGLVPPVNTMGCLHFTLYQFGVTKPFLLAVYGTAVVPGLFPDTKK